MLFEGGYAMEDHPAGRGIPADGQQAGTLPEKLAGVLERIAGHPADGPVVVSAGFLRWLAKEAGQAELNAEQRDEARTVARQQRARADAAAKLLTVGDARITALRGEIVALTGRTAGIEWKFARVTAEALADYELAGWEVRQMELGQAGHTALVALRRASIQKAAEPSEAARDTKPVRVVQAGKAGRPDRLAPAAASAAEIPSAASIEARLPQKQIDMLLAVRDGADIIPRHAGTRRALREAGLVEIVGKPAAWMMRLTPQGLAVVMAYRLRTGKKVA